MKTFNNISHGLVTMKKLFLIPLFVLGTSTAAWGVNVATWSALKTAIQTPNAAITLTATVTCDESDGSVIDLNGATINCGGSGKYRVTFATTGELTVKNATFKTTENTAISLPTSGGLVLNIENITVQNTCRYAVSVSNNTLNIAANCSLAPERGIMVADGSRVNNYSNLPTGFYTASSTPSTAEVTVHNYGTIIGNATPNALFKAVMYLYNHEGATYTFKNAGSSDAVYYIKNEGNVIYTATPAKIYSMDPVSMIGEVEYTSLAKAVAAVAENETIKLFQNVAEYPSTNLTITKSFTLDGQGHSLDKKIVVNAGKELTLKNITVANTNAGTTDKSTILLQDGSTVVLSNATLTPSVDASPAIRTITGAVVALRLEGNTTNVINANNVHCFYAANNGKGGAGSITIEGSGILNAYQTGTKCNVFSANTNYGGRYIVNAPNANFTARNEGSLFYVKADDPSVAATATLNAGSYNYEPNSSFIGEGCVKMLIENKYQVFAINASVAATRGIVAVLDGVAYTSLSTAIAAAEAGSTLTLWANAASVSVNKSLVVKANGYNASAISAASGYARAEIDGGYAYGKANKSGNAYTVTNFDEFMFAANYAAVNGDVIKFANDIAYTTNGVGLIDITKSITIDGQGYTLSGYGKYSATSYPAIGINMATQSNETELTLKNITISNPCKIASYYCRVIQAMGHVAAITLDNVNIVAPNGSKSNARGIQLSGAEGWSDKTLITIKDSKFNMGYSSYCITSYSPYILNATNSKFEAWNFATMKDADNSEGSRGTILNFDECEIQTINPHSGSSNDFEIFSIQDDGISINLNNCTTNAIKLGDQSQMVFDLNAWQRDHTRRSQDVIVNITGDNSNIQGVLASSEYWFEGYNWNLDPEQSEDYKPASSFHFTINISGGTYGFNPTDYDAVVIPDGYEVKEIVTTQSGETTTLFRVRKSIATTIALNDNEGNNETEEIKVESDVTLANDETTAKFVEVKGGTESDPIVTVTIPSEKTLEVSNGIDVTGNAQVVAQPGATVVVGEGGVIAESASNIVIETDETGAASFLINPDVIINTTPVVTIKMTTHVGQDEDDFYWQRFACPVANISSFAKSVPEAGTWIQGWNYSKNQWENVGGLSDMQPFHGYALTHNQANGTEVIYSFTGELAGNTNSTLEFSRRGYNFFGNSYAGYMDVLQILNELDLGAIDGSVWMWNSASQTYTGVPVQSLREHPERFNGDNSWKKEVAPMQTFILRWMNGSEAPDGEVSYADAIWGNPRYSAFNGSPALAPQRISTMEDNAFFRVVIKDANGKSDCVEFTEDMRLDDTYESGYDASKYMNERALNIFSTINEENYSSVATNNLVGKTISLQTLGEISYTMSFENVEGVPYAIKDTQTGAVTLIAEGSTYNFTAQPNATTEGRFQIVERYQVPTAVDNVSATPYANGIYTLLGQYVGESTLWNSLPGGVYVVNGVKLVK